jgi:predicted RNase H-like HicB family nuclease
MVVHMSTFSVVVEQDAQGWFVGYVPELPGCHTQGRTREQLLDRMKEAITLYLESGGKPEPDL